MPILDDIRVLDFTRVVAGPYATRVLADFGAEVIKVQCRKTAQGTEDNQTSYFQHYNRNKKSITLDMEQPEARELAIRLVQQCNVVAENFSPRVLENWGLTYPRLKAARGDIILLRMSAMGQSGPWRDGVAFAPGIQSLAGLTTLTSYAQGQPLGMGVPYADIISGLYGAMAVLAALEIRDRSGQGQCIDLSEYEAMVSLLGLELLAVQTGTDCPPASPAAPHGCYACQGHDRWCVIAVFKDPQFSALCRVMGLTDLTGDARFSCPADRRRHKVELDEKIALAAACWRAEDLVLALQNAGVAAGVVQNAQDLSSDPQLLQREFFRFLQHPPQGAIFADNTPLKMGADSLGRWRAAPQIGEHNAYVFGELLGLGQEKIADLQARGVIA
ncbi:MAG: CoA transferase [Desulfarculaceae bacterium]|jgi:crotonobetainyl-CoA:carnitine CoA-transferase CaiB-like acyl-CoA transferase